jgi:hypothetical protein
MLLINVDNVYIFLIFFYSIVLVYDNVLTPTWNSFSKEEEMFDFFLLEVDWIEEDFEGNEL